MIDKTIDFSKHVSSEQTHPLDKKALMEVLESISKNDQVIWSYVDHCSKLITDLNLWRDILSCIFNHSRCESLLDSLSKEQWTHFSRIVIGLKRTIELEDFTEVCKATLKFETPTAASMTKGLQLLDAIKRKEDVDLESIAADILQLGKHLRILGGILFNYRSKKSDEKWVVNIAHLPEQDIDHLIPLVNSILDTSTINLDKISES